VPHISVEFQFVTPDEYRWENMFGPMDWRVQIRQSWVLELDRAGRMGGPPPVIFV